MTLFDDIFTWFWKKLNDIFFTEMSLLSYSMEVDQLFYFHQE